MSTVTNNNSNWTINQPTESITPAKWPSLHVSDNILWAMEKQNITSLVTMDLSATFDTVDHDILLTILSTMFGIEDKALKWFDSYLHPRSYMVTVDGKYSREVDLDVSVPQGSCAGAEHFQSLLFPTPRGGTR